MRDETPLIKYVAIEIYDNAIRYEGNWIYYGNVKAMSDAEIQKIVSNYKESHKQNHKQNNDLFFRQLADLLDNPYFIGELKRLITACRIN